MKIYDAVFENMKNGKSSILRTELYRTSGTIEEGMKKSMETVCPEMDEQGRKKLVVTVKRGDTSVTIDEPIQPQERLIILGGGHISKILCDFASKCGFYVVVVDDRAEFANSERFPLASQIIQNSFSDAIYDLKINAHDYVVIISRGHASDGECLRAILSGTEPFYTGQIGSRKRVKAQFGMLIQEGYEKERLERIYTPIGIDINGKTPAEIAVSIAAELISCKRKPEKNSGKTKVVNESDLDSDIIKAIVENRSPAVLVTLIKSEGSTPRKAGAKMLVREDGSIVGSIGGGFGEACAIKAAARLIGTGRYEILKFSMDADVAARDGMACGGNIEILLEDFRY